MRKISKVSKVFEFGGSNPYTDEGSLIEVLQNQDKEGAFQVNYGLEGLGNLTYSQAAKRLGECIFHYLACESVLNNEGI